MIHRDVPGVLFSPENRNIGYDVREDAMRSYAQRYVWPNRHRHHPALAATLWTLLRTI